MADLSVLRHRVTPGESMACTAADHPGTNGAILWDGSRLGARKKHPFLSLGKGMFARVQREAAEDWHPYCFEVGGLVAIMDVNEEIEQLEEKIRKLQSRADLLRRVREALPAEKIEELHARFIEVHRTFCEALDAFSIDSAELFDELACLLGHVEDGNFEDWVTARGPTGHLFCKARGVAEEFCWDTNRGLYYETRKELEELFFELKEEQPAQNWFEQLLRNEGQLDHDEKMPPIS